MRLGSYTLLGVFAGVLLYLAALRAEAGEHRDIQRGLGCTTGPELGVVNAPAVVLSWVIEIRAVAPRNAGEAVPSPDPAWSPRLFNALGNGVVPAF